MATIGINFGSATSGAGFDVSSTVSSIMAIERAPETQWNNQVTTLKGQDTALTTLGTDLSNLSTALSSLTSFDGALSGKSGASSDDSTVELMSADGTASAGTHAMTVQQLAQTSTEFSSAVGASDMLTGSLTIAVGSGAAATIDLDADGDSLTAVAQKINVANVGVTAQVISDTSGSRLSLTSGTSGAAGQVSVGGAVVDGASAVTFSQGQAGQDAKFTVDGLSMTSASNTVSTAIPGVTFQLLDTSTSPVQVQIVNDTSGVTAAMQSFVTAYNQLVTDMAAQEGKDASGNAEPLDGSPVLSEIQSTMSLAMGTMSTESGSVKNLTQLGLTMGTDGTLSMDSSALTSALNSNFNDVASFFQTAGNFGQSLTTTLNNLGSEFPTGVVAMALSQNATTESGLNTNVTNLEAQLVTYQANLTDELNTANQTLEGIPDQLDEVNQIYAAITGYNTNANG